MRRGLSIPDGKLKQKIRFRQEGIRRGLQNDASRRGDPVMKKTFAILFASTALTVGVGLPAWSAMHAGLRLEDKHENTIDNTRGGAASAVLVSDDEEVDLDHGRSMRRDGDDDDDEEGDDGYEGGAAAGPAPVGTIAPPDNGLFGSGAVPKVKVN